MRLELGAAASNSCDTARRELVLQCTHITFVAAQVVGVSQFQQRQLTAFDPSTELALNFMQKGPYPDNLRVRHGSLGCLLGSLHHSDRVGAGVRNSGCRETNHCAPHQSAGQVIILRQVLVQEVVLQQQSLH